jgi:HSP20 family protein
MTNKIIIIGIMTVLITGLVVLGTQIQKLQAEVVKLSAAPATPKAAAAPAQQQPVRPRFAQPSGPGISYNDPWDAYSELARIQGQMDQLFNQTFRGGLWRGKMPGMDVYRLSSDIQDNQDKYVISMDIPGMDKENINVEVKNNTLLVSGERKSENKENNANDFRQERSVGSFSQSMPLPEDANASGISVNYDKGVLKVEIPKLVKANTPPETVNKIKVN